MGGLVPVMMQQILAREQVAVEQQKAALEQERSKRRREQEEHDLEMASKRLELAAVSWVVCWQGGSAAALGSEVRGLVLNGSLPSTPSYSQKAKDKGLVDHLPLIFGGGAAQQEEKDKLLLPSPAKSGKGKGDAAAGKDTEDEGKQANAANKVGVWWFVVLLCVGAGVVISRSALVAVLTAGLKSTSQDKKKMERMQRLGLASL
jgi:hypothetical protein